MQLNRRDLLARAGGAVVGMTALSQFPMLGTATAATPGCLWGARALPRGSETPETAMTNLEALVGRTFAVERQYQAWGDAMPGQYVLWSTSQGRKVYLGWHAYVGSPGGIKIPWTSISNGSRDIWITKQATALKQWGVPIYLNFHHEPEDDGACGTAAQYRAAWNHIHAIFDRVGVPNVTWVWTLMASTFQGGNGGAANWEPLHYDVVGVDGYNRHPDKNVQFKRFGEIFAAARSFAVKRGKPLAICEYGCVEQRAGDPMTKAEWFADAGQTMKAWPELEFACYSHVTTSEGYDYWVDSSNSSLDAFKALGHDAYFG
jgi:hypothetical protein